MTTAFIFVFIVIAASVLIFLFLFRSLNRKSERKGTVPNNTANADASNYDTLELKLFKLKTEVWGDSAEGHPDGRNTRREGNRETIAKFATTSFIPGQFDSSEDLKVTKSRSGISY